MTRLVAFFSFDDPFKNHFFPEKAGTAKDESVALPQCKSSEGSGDIEKQAEGFFFIRGCRHHPNICSITHVAYFVLDKGGFGKWFGFVRCFGGRIVNASGDYAIGQLLPSKMRRFDNSLDERFFFWGKFGQSADD